MSLCQKCQNKMVVLTSRSLMNKTFSGTVCFAQSWTCGWTLELDVKSRAHQITPSRHVQKTSTFQNKKSTFPVTRNRCEVHYFPTIFLYCLFILFVQHKKIKKLLIKRTNLFLNRIKSLKKFSVIFCTEPGLKKIKR